MDNYSFIAENFYDQMAPNDHNDSREESIMECPECDGNPEWSSCCGYRVVKHHCADCGEQCEIVTCPRCEGSGVINI